MIFRKILFLLYLFTITIASACSGSAEVVKDVFFGYKRGDKTDQNKKDAQFIINWFKSPFLSNKDKESFFHATGNVNGYMWVGSMVQNEGFKNNILPIIEKEVNDYGIPKTLYIEYTDGNSLQNFGIMLSTIGKDEVVKAAKLWSQGKKLNDYEGSKMYNKESVCYLSYNDRKPIVNDGFVGRMKTKNDLVNDDIGMNVKYTDSTILDANKLYPNILEHVNRDNVTNINNLITTAENNLGKDNPSDIYEVLESVLLFNKIAETARTTNDRGAEIKEKYKRMEKALIINIVLSIIGSVAVFGGLPGIALSLTTELASYLSAEELTGEGDELSLVTGIFGVFAPVFGQLSKINKFSDILNVIISSKNKDFNSLNKFDNVLEIRKYLGKVPKCFN